MDSLSVTFEERLQEIETYLDLLDILEKQAGKGAPKIGGVAITTQQQKILYSSVYLQLYNLVEATVTWCVEAVCDAAENGSWLPSDLTDLVRREWIRTVAKTHEDLTPTHRLDASVRMADKLLQALPILAWKVQKGGGGNWDDNEIAAITKRLGCTLTLTRTVNTGIKRHIRDDMGALALIKSFRNRLAHGTLSFAECGDGVTVDELKDLKKRTAAYLRAVIAAFTTFIDSHEFLIPARRPVV